MLRVGLANYKQNTAPADQLAFSAYFFDRSFDFHLFTFLTWRLSVVHSSDNSCPTPVGIYDYFYFVSNKDLDPIEPHFT